MKNYLIGILFVMTAVLAIVNCREQKEKKEKVNDLLQKEVILQTQLDGLKVERIGAMKEIDSLKKRGQAIRVQIVPTYVKFDSLHNKQLQEAMIKEYKTFNQ